MNRVIQYIILICFFNGLIHSEPIMNNNSLHPIDVEVHNGIESLLIHWSYPDSIEVKSINVYRRSSQQNEFMLIKQIINETDRFLDLECLEWERLFYHVEIIDINGYSFKSDQIRPGFGTCLPIIETIDKEQYQSLTNLINQILLQSFIEAYPDISQNALTKLVDIILTDQLNEYVWIEEYPIRYLNEIKSIFESSFKFTINDDLLSEVHKLEPKTRNYFMLTPKEWSKRVNIIYSQIVDNWILLANSFDSNIEKLKTSKPIIISSFAVDEKSNSELMIVVIDPTQLKQKEISLIHKNERQILESNNNLFPGSEILINNLENWENAELWVDDKLVDRVDFLSNMKIKKTLDNELIPTNNLSGIKVAKLNSEVWLNEILWDPKNSKISLEVAGIYSGSDKYVVSINDKVIWDLSFKPNFNMAYNDSTFYLNDYFEEDQLILSYQNLADPENNIEFFILDQKQQLILHRYPDGRSWSKTDQSSFGRENNSQSINIDNSLIPDLFVLYQNFPNPFNNNTRISFDLLQDATLSLYVTDATGRIKTIFSDKEFFNSGKYTFDWNAESFSTGIYFFTINAQVDGYIPVVFSRKMIYLK